MDSSTVSPHAILAAQLVIGEDVSGPFSAALEAEIARIVQGAIEADRAALFATMPVPPDDMGSLDGLEAYADAIAEWRHAAGFALQYDGPVGGDDRSISDDDLCANCVNLAYRPGGLSSCSLDWPGVFNVDGYCVTCPVFKRCNRLSNVVE